MVYDEAAAKPVFASGRAPTIDLESLLEESWPLLELPDVGWRLISARRKLGKTLFEIEVDGPGAPRRVIGKIASEGSCRTLFDALRLLWNAGFCPPHRHTVSEALGCLPEHGLILQELAPGRQAFDFIQEGGDPAVAAASQCAEWLTALHRAPVQAAPRHAVAEGKIRTWIEELGVELPDSAARLHRIEAALLSHARKTAGPLVPGHGDFHMMNIFISDSGRLTAIDVDKFGMAEREADVGYFLSQTASLGYMKHGNFAHTSRSRAAFIDEYERAGAKVRHDRASMYMASAFLKNLHFELCLLATGNTAYVEPWLRASERALLEGDIGLDGI